MFSIMIRRIDKNIPLDNQNAAFDAVEFCVLSNDSPEGLLCGGLSITLLPSLL